MMTNLTGVTDTGNSCFTGVIDNVNAGFSGVTGTAYDDGIIHIGKLAYLLKQLGVTKM
jgi:hypothetical protein